MSLTTCLKKAGTALNAEDRAAIIAAAGEYRRGGMEGGAAAVKAVADRIELVQGLLRGAEAGTPGPSPQERRRVARETERSVFRELVGMPSMVGKSVEQIVKAVRDRAFDVDLGETNIELLARALHKTLAKRAAELEKQKHRDHGVKAAAIGQATAEHFPDADVPVEQHSAFLAGFEHAMSGKTKSTPSGDHLPDRLAGYEAAGRWMDTEEGAAWYEGRPVSKLQNTGLDLRRWFDKLKADLKEKETDVEKAWKRIERATARADLFAPLLPDGVSPGYRTYVEHVRSNTKPFKEWLNDTMRWDGSHFFNSRYASDKRSNMQRILDGDRYPDDLTVDDRMKFESDPAYRATWLQDQAQQYIEQLRKFLDFAQGTTSVKEAAERFSERFVVGDSPASKNARVYGLPEFTQAGKDVLYGVKPARAGIIGGRPSDFALLRLHSDWTQHIIENEATIALPDRATPLTPPRMDRVERDGPEIRKGANITPEQFKKRFGMADVGFGNWVGAKQDQDHLNYAHDAFTDLAAHFGTDPANIGFGGDMHFTIGALGHGKYAAHFAHGQPSPIGPVNVINVTNTKGDGTVYHEWMHALDHYLGGEWKTKVRDRVLGFLQHGVLTPEAVEKRAIDFLFGGWYFRNDKKGDKVQAAIQALKHGRWISDRVSAYKKNADQLGKDYWGNEKELIARAAESWAANTLGHKNTYLVNPQWVGDAKVTQKSGYRGTPYPSGAERAVFNQVYAALAKSVTWDKGRPSISAAAFEKALPESLTAGERRLKELYSTEAMTAFRDAEQARRDDLAAAKAAEEAAAKKAEQEALDRLAEDKLRQLAPVVDTPPASDAMGPLTDEDLSNLFDEAASELRESKQEEPTATPPGEPEPDDLPPLGLADGVPSPNDAAFLRDKILAGQMVLLANTRWAARMGIPTIQSFANMESEGLGTVRHVGFGMFEFNGRDLKATWDAGGSMQTTEGGLSYTLLNIDRGTFEYPKARVAEIFSKIAPADPGKMTQLERDIAASGRTPPRPAPAAAADPSAAQLIAKAAALGVKGADQALSGLAALFGKPGRLNSFPGGFDEETYAQAKPHFQAALRSFQEAGKTLKDLFKMLIGQFGDGIKEYAIRFAKDEGLTTQLAAGPAPEKTESPTALLASRVKYVLDRGMALNWRELFELADEAFGGTQAEGKYTPKDAYDAMEAGINLHILSKPSVYSPAVGREDALRAIADLKRLLELVPTQTKRTAEQDQFQQFSTVPPFAFAANWVANVRATDTMAEFSAGIGGLAVFAKNAGASLVLNELSSRRAGILREVFPGAQVFQENAEQIHNILPDSIRPTVIVINPPFSSSASTGKKNTTVGGEHVEQALLRLAPGGRFVGIVGEGMAMDKPAFKDWWKKISAKYDVRAVIPVDGSGYAKYGTTFDNALLVIDKVKPSGNAPITTAVKDYDALIGLLAKVRDERPTPSVESNDALGAQPDPDLGGRGTPADGGGDQLAGPAGPGGAAGVGDGEPGGGSGLGAGGRSGRSPGGRSRPGSNGRGAGGATDRVGDDAGRGGQGDAGLGGGSDSTGDATGVTIGSESTAAGALTDSVFEGYVPQRLQVPGAKPHPGALVQSAAMASVLPPAPTYVPNLPKDTITKGLLSIAQIESVVYAGQAHEQLLEETVDPKIAVKYGVKAGARYRRGFFIGDGTGVGKGREISGILLDNLRQGRKKAVWVSEKQGLINDAKRDFKGVGGDDNLIFNQNKTLSEGKIDAKDGIIFTTYSTLRSGSLSQKTTGKPATQGQYEKAFKEGAPVVVRGDSTRYTLRHFDLKRRRVHVKDESGYSDFFGFTEVGSIDGFTDFADPDAVRAIGAGTHAGMPGAKAAKKAGQSRINQLVEWLGPDFDGVIAFDEAHNAGNAVPMNGERGSSDPSAQALAVVELQARLPNARVVYVSATGATEVSNLSFATRLGLWGPGTAFPSVDNFIAQMTAGGLATMELVARDMKQIGAYLARSLSFDGVTYSRIEHELTPLQRDVYDKLAEGWQVTLRNMNAAMALTGATDEDTGKAKNKKAVSAMKSAYWGAQQRFFNQIITSMQMPSVVEDIQRDLDAGNAIVLQLVNTNEAQQERALAEQKEAGESEDLEDLDLSPIEQLVQMVEKAFPVQQYQDEFDSEGKRTTVPVVDASGAPVQNKEAVAMRDALIKDLRMLPAPDGPLEILLDTFGPALVAEVTGRKQRLVRKPDADGNVTRQLEKRGASAARADADAFMEDKRRIMIFSDAGGTGYSFQADLTKKNQRKRQHYLLQPGWRANKAVQGMGRSHRTNQKSAPHYKLASTDIPAHKRFLSAIARRLDQLGALTKGQRDTSSGGLFSEKDNLESVYATQAARRLIDDVKRGQVEGLSFIEFLTQMGPEDIVDPNTGAIPENKYPPTRQFLNRMLSLKLDVQEIVFTNFIARMEEQVELAAARGMLDTGMQTIRALETSVTQDDVVHTDERTGAETRFVELQLKQPTRMYTFPSEKTQGAKIEWVTNVKSGRVWAKVRSGNITKKDGSVVEKYRMLGTGGMQLKDATDFKPGVYKTIDAAAAEALWEQETAARPPTYTETKHMIVGAMLPIWDRLKTDGTIEVARTQTADGQRLLGRVIAPKDVADIRKRLDLSSSASKLPPEQILARVLKGEVAELANGWKLERARVSDDLRVEIKAGPYALGGAAERELVSLGVLNERIEWRQRFFIPVNKPEVLAALLKNKPVVDLVDPKAAKDEDDDTRMSRGDSQAGVPMQDASAVVDAIRQAFPAAPQIYIHESVDKAPKALVAAIKKAGALNDVEAAFHEGEIHVFPGNLASIERMAFVVGHHELRHYGLRSMLGPSLGPVMLKLWNENPAIQAAAKQVMADGHAKTRVLAVEEALADMPVETLMALKGWDKIVAAVRRWLRTVAARLRDMKHPGLADLFEPERWTDNDVAALVGMAENVSRVGDTRFTAGGTAFQRAWHGTPHRGIQRFSTDAIGTGEGQQVYGWGLYFASRKEVAEFYRKSLSKAQFTYANDAVEQRVKRLTTFKDRAADTLNMLVQKHGTDKTALVDALRAYTDRYSGDRETLKAITAYIEDGLMVPQPMGQLYEVEVPEDNELLDWDATLGEQPAFVKNALRGTDYEIGPPEREVERIADDMIDAEAQDWADETGGDPVDFSNNADRDKYIERAREDLGGLSSALTGKQLYRMMMRDAGFRDNSFDSEDYQRDASQGLLSYGIKGIKYLDGAARRAGGTDYNYVIFDGSHAEIQTAVYSRAGKTDTPAFRKWFGDSKVVDAAGKPLVVYHGTAADFTAFDTDRGMGAWFARDAETASFYADVSARLGGNANVRPVYLSLQNPASGEDFSRIMNKAITKPREQRRKFIFEQLEREGFDGVADGGKVFIAVRPTQIKSAIGNNGDFDDGDPDIRFSRAPTTTANAKSQLADALTSVRDAKLPMGYVVNDFIAKHGELSAWDKTVGTMHNLAERNPLFKPVYDAANEFLNDVSSFATEAADLAPTVLPKLEGLRDIGKTPLSAKDTEVISKAIFQGTLSWTRDEDGQPIEEPDPQKAGIVWRDGELTERFGMNAKQISLYREFRAATDKSLTDLAITDMVRFVGKDAQPVAAAALASGDVRRAATILQEHLAELAADAGASKAAELSDTGATVGKKAEQAARMIRRGYAPLMRFGQYTLDVTENGQRVYFGMFESRSEANRFARRMQAGMPKATFSQGTLSQDAYKLFAGVSPETAELFGNMLGLESQGSKESSLAFQEYLKLAKDNRSTMKRLIERKGTAGFSEDAGRVLAGFVYSNARQASKNLHFGEISQAVQKIQETKGEGQLMDAAVSLQQYITNPVEEAQKVKGLLFAQFLGGSLAAGLVNLSQSVMVTFPYLSQFGGVAKSAAQMKAALADAMKWETAGEGKATTGDKVLDAAIKKAEEDGVISPQEVHALIAQAGGSGALRAGDGTQAGNLAAKGSNFMSKLMLVWGRPFSLAEQFNRRVTFIAAYRTAVAQGMASPAAFAEKAVVDTQFNYTKANRPQWARGAIGSVLFTFKTYSISYVELMVRMGKSGPEGKKAALVGLGMLFLMSGLQGLPGADDLDDLIDGALQRMGYNFSAKAKKQAFFASVLGDGGARFVMSGLSGLPGAPIDVAGRLGLGNLIPGTGLLTKKDDHTRDVAEIFGPAGSLAKQYLTGLDLAVQGELAAGVKAALPVAAANVAKAADMLDTGQYRDTRGRKVIETDTGDALAKAIGFQPNDVARVQRATFEVQQRVAQAKMRESEIAEKWARGIVDQDNDVRDEARAELARWNDNNPESRINITTAQLLKRMRAMREDKIARLTRTTPKEMRNEVRRELEAAR